MSPTGDINKGFDELKKALNKVSDKTSFELIIFGNTPLRSSSFQGFQAHYFDHIFDDNHLINLYNSVELILIPSLQENLSNTIMESLACGTPVVAFNIGGNSDMVNHKENGYLAKPYDTKDLADGIEWILESNKYDSLCKNAREKVLTHFDSKLVAQKHIDLYQRILENPTQQKSTN